MKIVIKIICWCLLMFSCKNEATLILSKYENGQIREQEIKGLDSIPYGYVLKQIFYSDGKIMCQGMKHNNQRQGKWNCYFEDGELEWSTTYKDGEEHGTTLCYYKNGTWKKVSMQNGILEGPSVEFNFDSLVNEYFYVQGEYKNGLEYGEWIIKYEDKTLMSTMNYIEGSKEGVFKQFHKNGVVSVQGQFKNNEFQDSILIFNDKSELVRIELFEKGKMITQIKLR